MSYLFGSNLSIYFSVKKTIQSLFALIDTWPLCSISSLFRAHQRARHILLESDLKHFNVFPAQDFLPLKQFPIVSKF